MASGDMELPALPPAAPRGSAAAPAAIPPDQLTRKKLQGLLHVMTAELKARGTKTAHIFLPFRSRVDDGKLHAFFGSVFPGGVMIDTSSRSTVRALLHQFDEFTLVCAMKYLWCRLPGHEIIGWNVYLEFRRKEAAAGHPKDAFLTIMPKCLASSAHASIVYDFLDLLISVAANAQYNHLSGRKIAKMASMWAFSCLPASVSAFYDATAPPEVSFLDGLDAWKARANGLFHLVLAFLRAMLPDTGADTLNLPKTLQSLLVSNTYPPPEEAASLKSVITIPCVHIRSTHRSADPYALISKVRRSLSFDKKDDFLSVENYTILKNIFHKPSTDDIVATLTEESRRVLSRLTAAPSADAYGIYPGWCRAPPDDPAVPLHSEIEISNVTLQDYFIWTWLSSLASDQSPQLKALFGRSIVVEAGLRGFQKWMVVTETSIPPAEYLARFKDVDTRALKTRNAPSPQRRAKPAQDLPLPPPPAAPPAVKKAELPATPNAKKAELPPVPSQNLLPEVDFQNDQFHFDTYQPLPTPPAMPGYDTTENNLSSKFKQKMKLTNVHSNRPRPPPLESPQEERRSPIDPMPRAEVPYANGHQVDQPEQKSRQPRAKLSPIPGDYAGDHRQREESQRQPEDAQRYRDYEPEQKPYSAPLPAVEALKPPQNSYLSPDAYAQNMDMASPTSQYDEFESPPRNHEEYEAFSNPVADEHNLPYQKNVDLHHYPPSEPTNEWDSYSPVKEKEKRKKKKKKEKKTEVDLMLANIPDGPPPQLPPAIDPPYNPHPDPYDSYGAQPGYDNYQHGVYESSTMPEPTAQYGVPEHQLYDTGNHQPQDSANHHIYGSGQRYESEALPQTKEKKKKKKKSAKEAAPANGHAEESRKAYKFYEPNPEVLQQYVTTKEPSAYNGYEQEPVNALSSETYDDRNAHSNANDGYGYEAPPQATAPLKSAHSPHKTKKAQRPELVGARSEPVPARFDHATLPAGHHSSGQVPVHSEPPMQPMQMAHANQQPVQTAPSQTRHLQQPPVQQMQQPAQHAQPPMQMQPPQGAAVQQMQPPMAMQPAMQSHAPAPQGYHGHSQARQPPHTQPYVDPSRNVNSNPELRNVGPGAMHGNHSTQGFASPPAQYYQPQQVARPVQRQPAPGNYAPAQYQPPHQPHQPQQYQPQQYPPPPQQMPPQQYQPPYQAHPGYAPQGYAMPPRGYQPKNYGPPQKAQPTTSELAMMGMPSANTFKKNKPSKANLRAALNQNGFGI